jgi:hypothetical protein
VPGGERFVLGRSAKQCFVARRHLGRSETVASFLAPIEIEGHGLPLFQLLEWSTDDHARVKENVSARVARLDETDSLVRNNLRDNAYSHIQRLRFVAPVLCSPTPSVYARLLANASFLHVSSFR